MALAIPYLLIAVVCVAVYVAQSILYNLFFHPLRSYPGPVLAKISIIWSRQANFYGLKYMKIHQAHRKYGSVVRIAPNELSFADPAAVRDIYTNSAFQKEENFYFAKRGYEEEHLFSFRNPEAHNQRRKLLSRGYSQGSLLDIENDIAAKIQTFLDLLATKAVNGNAVDIYTFVHLLSFDVVYRLLFGDDPRSLELGGEHRVLSYLRAWRPLFTYKEVLPQLEWLGVYLPGIFGNNFRKVRQWKIYSVDLIKTSRQNNIVTPFFRSVLYGEKDGYLNRPLTDSEVAEECMSGMFGGTGTTANTFVFLLWATLQRPEVVEKLEAELRAAFPNPDSVVDYQALTNETLRMYPTIVAILPRVAKKDTIVAGLHIPKGTVVGTQNYTIHRSERAFHDPDNFLPERWLDDKNVDARKEAFVPFSVGPRRCIGMNMRPEEMRIFDSFNAGPAGRRLLIRLKEKHSEAEAPGTITIQH
ncbi:cytochrome P450 [Fusarium oxysporum Fo47]|uniref:cytochrome P450 n=1 Tax=Fusarium oxysporum Fo47 TaxID=660027 RepID=UPI00286982F5|nr:cytochrome P450 [Fusarium oxysporum Fo47]QKD53803.2 cytochrome P450 [Fusarium oxysporum Fo47]